MAADQVERRLAAILSADVAGYSRLMADDEQATVRTITAFRAEIGNLVSDHRGRIVDATGDNALAEFPTALDAVECAVDIQRELGARNADLDEGRRMEFRIGVHMGDVTAESDRIYGDSVNIAARLESLADPGGICISSPVYDQVKRKLKLPFENMGEQRVKNVHEPVKAYRVLTESGHELDRKTSTKEIETVAALPDIPQEPSIAVLPFVNMSADPAEDYFGDGLTEDVITDLSLIPGLFVIARTSSFSYKGRSVDVRQVGQEMGVRYVLEGSVRRSGNHVRATAQLIEAARGHHVWAKKYDRGLEDVFALQDDLTKEIVSALDVQLVSGERGRYQRSHFKSAEAGEALYRGMAEYKKFDETSHVHARMFFEQFTRLEPDSSVGYDWLAQLSQREVFLGWGGDRDSSLRNMGDFIEKALAIDDTDPLALGEASMHQCLLGNHDQSIAYAQQALASAPGMDSPYYTLGWSQMFNDTPLEAIENLKRSMRLSPIVTAPRSTILGTCYRNAGQLQLAVATLKNTVKRFPAFISGRVALASCYALMGREQEARQEASEILQRDPGYTIARYTTPNLYRNKETMKNLADALRKAGIPE